MYGVLCLMYATIIFMGNLMDNQDSLHRFDGFIGWTLSGLHIVLWAVFYIQCNRSYYQFGNPMKNEYRFGRSLVVVGSYYI
jgi:hypothetical protein